MQHLEAWYISINSLQKKYNLPWLLTPGIYIFFSLSNLVFTWMYKVVTVWIYGHGFDHRNNLLQCRVKLYTIK